MATKLVGGQSRHFGHKKPSRLTHWVIFSATSETNVPDYETKANNINLAKSFKKPTNIFSN
jgi:hypothetical protein